jgi:hypothetical protein
MLFRAHRHRPDWGSLKQAYEDSYRMATTQPQDYQRMSLAAAQRMEHFSAIAVLQKRVEDFFGLEPQPGHVAQVRDSAPC